MTATQTIAGAWRSRAAELADWAIARVFVRTDRYGEYYTDRETGQTKKAARPKVATEGAVTRDLLCRHFRAVRTADVVGAFSLAPGVSTGRSAAADIDAHDATADPERNRRYAVHLYRKLALIGFRPLLATWDAGSFHLHTLFDTDVSGEQLYSFARWLVSDAEALFGFAKPVEHFPKRAAVPADRFGNWLRLVGRHHTRDAWASVFDGTNWLVGAEAVEHVLSLTGDSPELIPLAARLGDAPEPARTSPPRRPAGGSVFDAWKAGVTIANVVGWLEALGHVPFSRTATRCDFTRAGKQPGEESFNVQVRDGVPITYCFSTNAGLPDNEGLNPVDLRCFLKYGSTDRSAMAKLAVELERELGGTKSPDPRGARPTATPDAPRSGAAIILAHFRELYQPAFKRGTAIHCADGSVVPMGEGCALCDSDLIGRLETAHDAPRAPSVNGVPGAVKRNSLPGFFKTWSKVAWGDMLRDLPDEDTADLGGLAPAREEFRRLVREAMLSEMTLGDKDERELERRSLIDWCHKFAKPGPWRSIRSKKCWCKVRQKEDGQLVLMVAIRHELFAQLRAARSLSEMGSNTFTRRATNYGVGHTSRADRPNGQSAVVLAEDFVADLCEGLADDEPPEASPGPSDGPTDQSGSSQGAIDFGEPYSAPGFLADAQMDGVIRHAHGRIHIACESQKAKKL